MFRAGLLLIIIACIALAVTNPNEESHKEVIYEKVSNKAGMEGFLGKAAGALLGEVDAAPLKYNNYFLFSTTTFGDDTLSVGAMTKVWPKKSEG